MKKTLTMLAALAMASSVFAQGTVEFSNFATGEIKRPDGSGASTGFTAGLFLASNLSAPLAGGTTDFITGTGFLNAVNVTVPGIPGRSPATFVVRAWETSAGSFANATIKGESAPFTVASLGGAGSPPDVPASMDTFVPFTMVPEPSTYALGALGLGALAMMRRRK